MNGSMAYTGYHHDSRTNWAVDLMEYYKGSGYKTQKEFAAACGIDEGIFSNIMHGRRSLGDIDCPAKLLNITVALMVGNGKQSIRTEKDLVIFLSKVPRLLASERGRQWVMQEAPLEAVAKGVSWNEPEASTVNLTLQVTLLASSELIQSLHDVTTEHNKKAAEYEQRLSVQREVTMPVLRQLLKELWEFSSDLGA